MGYKTEVERHCVVGFYRLTDNGTLGANKACLEYNGSSVRAFISVTQSSGSVWSDTSR